MLDRLKEIVHAANREILNVYGSNFDVDLKEDQTPITKADRIAHELIGNELTQLAADIPLVSEESALQEFSERRNWDRYWLVDPLDGTRDFVERNGEFTVNIALVTDGDPSLGVIGVPTTGVVFSGDVARSRATMRDTTAEKQITSRSRSSTSATLVQSRHHAGAENEAIQRYLKQEGINVECTPMGSSLKMCEIAQGLADLYVRFGPTSEWDIAAAHAILKAAGGEICLLDGSSKRYNQSESVLNPAFFACGSSASYWSEAIAHALR